MPHATVSRCLERRGCSRRPRPAKEEVRRFEWPCPGELLQMDTKRFAALHPPRARGHRRSSPDGRREAAARRTMSSSTRSSTTTRGSSSQSCTRTSAPLDGRQASSCARSAFFASLRHRTEAAADRQRVRLHARTARLRGCSPSTGSRHRTIPPRTPKRNGKVERYQQTLKREWGLGQRYRSSRSERWRSPHWLSTTTRPGDLRGSATVRPSAAFGTSQAEQLEAELLALGLGRRLSQ